MKKRVTIAAINERKWEGKGGKHKRRRIAPGRFLGQERNFQSGVGERTYDKGMSRVLDR